VLLFFSFTVVGAVFNIAISYYIRSSAIATLDDARSFQYELLDFVPSVRSDSWFFRNRRGLFRANVRNFIMDAEYQPLSPFISYSEHDISTLLKMMDIAPIDAVNMRLRGVEQSYYIATARVPGEQARYMVFYVDVTELQRFVHSVNMMLVFVAAFIFLVAMTVTRFLAGSLARPLYILRDFAQRMGQGDFEPNPISFKNEEFEILNQSLNHAARQLAKYDNDQKTFFQNMSHELRTPLMTIKSYAEGIKYGIMEPEKSAQTILDASNRLSEMVDDVLYLSRLDNIAKPVMESVDIRALIQERIVMHRPLADINGLVINFDTEAAVITVSCAVSYMSRALDNLISNAVRFAETAVSVECKRTGGHVQITVADDGPGFEPEILPHVFERFFKGKTGLSGIGLSVVRSITEQHKGTATAQNGKKGAVLTISIPI